MGLDNDPPEPRTTMIRDGGPDPYGFTSLEHRIHQSDVVAHVRLKSIVPDGTNLCYDDDEWIPVVRYEFEVFDYLKGIGGDKISANVSFGLRGSSSRSERDYYMSRGDARSAARYFVRRRSSEWDRIDAVIFLKQDSDWIPDCEEGDSDSTVSYGFTLSESRQAPEYRIDSAFNRAWLPMVGYSVSSSDGKGVSQFRLSLDSTAHTPRDKQYDRHGTISLDELRTEIQVLEDAINRKETMRIEGYVECLDAKHDHERRNLAAEESGGEIIRHWWRHSVKPDQMNIVGLPYQEPIVILDTVDVYYTFVSQDGQSVAWLEGADAELFDVFIEAVNVKTPSTGQGYRHYERYQVVTDAKLSTGTYRFELHVQHGHFRPCDYYDGIAEKNYVVEIS